VPLTTRDICERALLALNIVAAGEVMGADDGVFVLGELNDYLDELNAERSAVYADVYSTWTLTPTLAPHTIGPTGTFVVTQRPQTIDYASLQVGSTFVEIRIADRDWWLALANPAQVSSVPANLYYNPTWPNGQLNFWPVPSAASLVELVTRQVLGQLALTDTFSLPPGYRSMITKTLAERIATPYEKPVPAQLAKDAAKARATVADANTVIPHLTTRDAGIPGSRSGAGYNYRTGGGGGTPSRWSE